MKKLLLVFIGLVVLLSAGSKSNLFNSSKKTSPQIRTQETTRLLLEESAITDAIEKALPSVVTIAISKTTTSKPSLQINPFNPFEPFRRMPGREQTVEGNIGSGFIVSSDGLIVTNKHVVADIGATYKVLTNDGKTHEVQKISRDPLNDLAILKINADNLTPMSLGDSSNLKLGQVVVAIGTPLGQFTNTVTSGIISGLKRGITAGSPFENFVERLDNVIQTDAAISAGNSGGPLINSSGVAIGVNTAVSQQGQNIGFAIPINVVKDLLANFNKAGGKIERPFLGIRYQMITKELAIANKLPQGAYVIEVIENSPADKAGIVAKDVITKFDGHTVQGADDKTLQKLIAEKKIGDRIQIQISREGKSLDITVNLQAFE